MNTWHKQDHKYKNQDVKLKSEADREPKQKLWKIHKNIAAAYWTELIDFFFVKQENW